MKLDKKVREDLSQTMEYGEGNWTLEEFIQDRLNYEIGAVALESAAHEYPYLSPKELKSFLRFLRIIDLEDGWLRRGVARRFMLNEPAELRKFLSLKTRLSYLWNKAIADSGLELDSPYTLVWDVLRALAARDHDSARAFLNLGIVPLKKGHRDAVVAFNTVCAIVGDDTKQLIAVAKDLKSAKASNQWFASLFATLSGIIQRSPEQFEMGMAKLLDSKSIWLHHYEKAICIEAHGLFELARTVSPKLVSSLDVDRLLPWDQEFYTSTLVAKSPLDGANLNILPSDMRTAIVKLTVPKWLRFPNPDA